MTSCHDEPNTPRPCAHPYRHPCVDPCFARVRSRSVPSARFGTVGGEVSPGSHSISLRTPLHRGHGCAACGPTGSVRSVAIPGDKPSTTRSRQLHHSIGFIKRWDVALILSMPCAAVPEQLAVRNEVPKAAATRSASCQTAIQQLWLHPEVPLRSPGSQPGTPPRRMEGCRPSSPRTPLRGPRSTTPPRWGSVSGQQDRLTDGQRDPPLTTNSSRRAVKTGSVRDVHGPYFAGNVRPVGADRPARIGHDAAGSRRWARLDIGRKRRGQDAGCERRVTGRCCRALGPSRIRAAGCAGQRSLVRVGPLLYQGGSLVGACVARSRYSSTA